MWFCKEDKAVHYVKEMFNVGDKFPTLSWWLGEEVSYIELVENIVNNLIREGKNVTVTVFTENTLEELLKE
ncbi:hypothetical protein NQ317_019710, partial [Molorchus minor]